MKHTILSTLLAIAVTTSLSAEPDKTVEIRLASNPEEGFTARRDKPVEMSSKRASKFRIQAGFTDARFISLELVGASGNFVRHRGSVCLVHERPKANRLFEADATFKMIQLDGETVQFEASNFPGMFITAMDDGSVVIARKPDALKSTFVLKPVSE